MANDSPLNTSWHFPPMAFGMENGSSDPGVAHFSKDATKGLIRETIQNSLDARFHDSQCVTVRFSLRKISKDSFPDFSALDERIKSSLLYTNEQQRGGGISLNSNQTKVKEALDEIRRNSEVEFLEISDFGTTGLSGAYTYRVQPNRFYRLLFQVGTNTISQDAGAGGTWGIGKHAPFAVSRLRTVFYSTLSFDPIVTQERKAFIGKTILSTHKVGEQRFQGTGYFGLMGEGQVTPLEFEPYSRVFDRKEIGTSIFIAMPDLDEDFRISWKRKILLAALENYYAAIVQGKLSVVIGEGADHINVDAGSVLGHAKELEEDHFAEVGSLTEFILALTTDNSEQIKEEETPNGHFKVFAFETATESKRESIIHCMRIPRQKVEEWKIRNGLGIRGVFIVHDKVGNEKFAQLEPVTHDNWYCSRGLGKKAKDWTKNALKEIFSPALENGEILILGKLGKGTVNVKTTTKDAAKPTEITLGGAVGGSGREGSGFELVDLVAATPVKSTATPKVKPPKNISIKPKVPRTPKSQGGESEDNPKLSGKPKSPREGGLKDDPHEPEGTGQPISGVAFPDATLRIKRMLQAGRDAKNRAKYRLAAHISGGTSGKLRMSIVGYSSQDEDEKVYLHLNEVTCTAGAGIKVRIDDSGEKILLDSESGGDFTLELTSNDVEWYQLRVESV